MNDVARNYSSITTEDALKALVDKLMAEGLPLGFDIETGYHGPDRKKGAVYPDWDEQFIAGFSITNSKRWAFYVPVAHDYQRLENAWEIVQPALETLPVICHNAKFEKRNLRALERKGHGPRIELNVAGDSMLQSYALGRWQFHGLKPLTEHLHGHRMANIESLFPEATKAKLDALRFNVLDANDPEVIAYACEDSVWCLADWEYMNELLEEDEKARSIYNLELPTMSLLCDMEDAGHATDWDAIAAEWKHAAPFEASMLQAAREGLTKMSGEDQSELNLKSAPQMREVLYNKMGLTTTRTTKSGSMSTDATALEGLSRDYPPVKKVLEVREVANLGGRLKKWHNEYSLTHDKRVHPNFNQIIVASGRFSANDPSIQQLPKEWRWTTLMQQGLDVWDDETGVWDAIQNHEGTVFGKHYWGGNFRDFLIAAKDTYLLFFDYSQVELRCLAGMSKEPYLIDAFNRGIDIHTATAAMMLQKDLDKITSKDRGRGKTINFGIVYGMGAKLLAEQLAIPVWEAQDLLDRYMAAFTEVAGWMDDQKAFGIERGYVFTHFGRKVPLWDLQSSNFAIRGKGERLCVNAPVQGSAADIMKISMLRARKALIDAGLWMTKVRMINNVHDALTFEVDNDVNPVELRNLLKPCISWPVPGFPEIVADWDLGQSWGSAKTWKQEDVAFIDGCWQIIPEDKPAKSEPAAAPVVDTTDRYPNRPENWTPDEDPYVSITLPAMPTPPEFAALLKILGEFSGNVPVQLRTPEGEVSLSNYPVDGSNYRAVKTEVERLGRGVVVDSNLTEKINAAELAAELEL